MEDNLEFDQKLESTLRFMRVESVKSAAVVNHLTSRTAGTCAGSAAHSLSMSLSLRLKKGG